MDFIYIIFYILLVYYIIKYFNVAGRFNLFLGKNILLALLFKEYNDFHKIKITNDTLCFTVNGRHIEVSLKNLNITTGNIPFNKVGMVAKNAFLGVKEAIEDTGNIYSLEGEIFPMLKNGSKDNPALSYVLRKKHTFKFLDQNSVTDTLKERAFANLERSCAFVKTKEAKLMGFETAVMLNFITNDGLDAVRIMLPSFFNRFVQRFDATTDEVIISIPNRDFVAIAPVKTLPHTNNYIDKFIAFAHGMNYNSAPYPITGEIYSLKEDCMLRRYNIKDEPNIRIQVNS